MLFEQPTMVAWGTGPQTILQPPQWLGSLVGLKHVPPQQISPLGQTVPHPPQLAGSEAVFLQWLEQHVPEQQTTFRPVVPHKSEVSGHWVHTAMQRFRGLPRGNWLQKA